MDVLSILRYGGMAALVVLLVLFELKDGRIGGQRPQSVGYEYYTADGSRLRIYKAFGTLYKVYPFGPCPVPVKAGRYGTYFTVRARSSAEAESLIDALYQGKETDGI